MFSLEHGGDGVCGIPDGDTIIMTGGVGQNYVTRLVLQLDANRRQVKGENNKNLHRYNITGFVEELPQLPDIRRGHACGAFPTNKVRSKEQT